MYIREWLFTKDGNCFYLPQIIGVLVTKSQVRSTETNKIEEQKTYFVLYKNTVQVTVDENIYNQVIEALKERERTIGEHIAEMEVLRNGDRI